MILSNKGQSLRLRQTAPEDAPLLLRAYEDESFIRLYRSNNTRQTEEQITNMLAKRLEQDPATRGYIEFMIEHKQHGPLGVAVLGDYTPIHKRAEYLIGLFEEQRRSLGYGTEATLLVLDLAFNIYKLHKIYTYVYDYNNVSEKSTLKIGFKQEGFLEDHHYLLKEKRHVGLYLNGMTEERFRNCEPIRRYSQRLLGRDITQPPLMINVSAENQLPVETGQKFLDWLARGNNSSES